MMTIFDPVRDVTLASIVLRLVGSVLCGGMIGIEREYKRRNAGFRTHILICLGAAMTTLTSEYMLLYMHYSVDISRMGASVVSGIGFIGAGTIIITQRQRIKGLTTAAGLWTAAIVGLAFGAGFYEGAIITTAMVLLAELVFTRLEKFVLASAPMANVYVEYQDKACLDGVIKELKSRGVRIQQLEITRNAEEPGQGSCALFLLQMNKKGSVEKTLNALRMLPGVQTVEEL